MSLPFQIAGAPTTFEMVPRYENIGSAVDHAIRLATGRGPWLDDALHDTMRLAITEVINNVLEHARHPTSRPVRFHALKDSSFCYVCVQDEGGPLPEGLVTRPVGDAGLPVPNPEACEPGELPEGGWGWYLIHSSVTMIKYERARGMNYMLLGWDLALEGTPTSGIGSLH